MMLILFMKVKVQVKSSREEKSCSSNALRGNGGELSCVLLDSPSVTLPGDAILSSSLLSRPPLLHLAPSPYSPVPYPFFLFSYVIFCFIVFPLVFISSACIAAVYLYVYVLCSLYRYNIDCARYLLGDTRVVTGMYSYCFKLLILIHSGLIF